MRLSVQGVAHFRERRHRCTSCRRKPDQHDVYAQLRRIRQPFALCPTRLGWTPSLSRTGLPTRSPSQTFDPRGRYPFSPTNSPSEAGVHRAPWRHRLRRFTGPISPACGQYVRYLLNRSDNERSSIDTDGATILKSQTSPSHPILFPVRSPIIQQ